MAVKQKVTMVDETKVIAEVELNATTPNELIGSHIVYTTYGTIEFTNGKAKVTKDIASKLAEENLVK